MKVALVCLACTAGCGFRSAVSGLDASDVDAADAPDAAEDATPIDAAPIDAPDAAPPARTRAGLIGLWELNETAGTTLADTSDGTPKVPLSVMFGTVTLGGGTMTPDGIAVVASGPAPHLNKDVSLSRAVTLEAWVIPAMASQGSTTAPVVVAGLCSSIKSRNISILQAGTRWVARVRTTTDLNGGPDLVSSTDIVPGVMTHLVVVSDATQRMLYVDGQPDAVDAMPGPPLGWDGSYKMVLGDELSQNRQWSGTFALVAMYKQALTSELVELNHAAGPEGM